MSSKGVSTNGLTIHKTISVQTNNTQIDTDMVDACTQTNMNMVDACTQTNMIDDYGDWFNSTLLENDSGINF